MGIFKRKIKFISATCPKCQGNLELDANLETAFCQYCGAQCIVENARRKEKKQTGLETIISFVERQQDLRRQDKREKQRREEEEERKNREELKRTWWIYALVMLGIFALIALMGVLEKYGIF